MFLVGKAAYSGIVFLLLTTWISGPRPKLLNSTASPGKEVPQIRQRSDVNTTQLALQDKGNLCRQFSRSLSSYGCEV